MRSLPLVLALLVAAAHSAPAAAQKKAGRPFTARDMHALMRVTSPVVSPDGKKVVYSVRVTDFDANKGRTDLWIVDVAGGAARQLTTDPANDSDPVWAPDGKSIYFISSRVDPAQVFQVGVEGGEARKVTDLPLDALAFTVAPDGKRLIVAMDVFPDCDTLECTTRRLDETKNAKTTGRLYKKLMIRHWDTWEDGRRQHLFVVTPGGKARPIDLMKGMDADSPTLPFGGAGDFTVTPDGKSLVFVAKDAGREAAWSTNNDLFLVPLDGSAKPKNLTAANKGDDSSPVFSDDGKWLVYLSMPRAGYESDRRRVMLRAWPKGEAKELTPAWDRSPSEIVWSRDGKTLYAAADHVGHQAIFAIDVATGKVSELVTDGANGSIQVADGGVLVYGHDDLDEPVELFTFDPAGKGPSRKLTTTNDDLLADLRFGTFEQFSFTGAKGDKVYGWLVRPVGFTKGKKVPMAYLIHGGPQGSFGNHFHYRWNPQTYAGRGYAVVMVDFHGSTGYGQQFTDDIRGDWGGKPLEDLKLGLAHVLKTYDFIDDKKVCALGASYGGYMINLIAGVWNEPFACLVSHDGNLDERAAYFDTEELWFPEWDHEGTPWDNPEGYAKHNPVDHVKNWKKPILFIHGGKDFRVVETQGIMSFNAAQRRGVPSEFLYFPDENHWVLKPLNSILWHDTVLGWLDRWTQQKKGK